MSTQISSPSPFSAHSDVLSATPTTPSGRTGLIEELKSRGRGCVATKNYPDACALYTKAIDVVTGSDDDGNGNTLAVLYSNRSLCQLQMNRKEEAYDDACAATCQDPDYLKGYWRLGQACVAWKKLQEGLQAYRRAVELDPQNKALKKEVAKVGKLIDEEELRKKEEGERESNGEEKKEETSKKKVVQKKNTEKEEPAKQTNSATSTVTSTEGFTKSDHVRGYKIVDGRKTSFFHHEQTDEEKRLIGDIAPKRIDTTSTQSNSPQRTDPESNSNTSAWNKAGTWEERDVTPWAISSIQKTLLDDCKYTLPPSSPDPNAHIFVTKVSGLEKASHASVATVRGKKRYIFEFTVCLHWKLTFGNGVDECEGTLTFDDIDGTHEIGEGYDVGNFTVKDNGSDGGLANARFLIERFVRDGGFKDVVEQTLDNWITTFRDTY